MTTTVQEMAPDDRQSARPVYVPSATYRLQLHPGFTLDAARAVVPYLAAPRRRRLLHVAVLHGGAGQHPRLRRLQSQRDQPGARGRRGPRRVHLPPSRPTACGHIVDFVPNHMGIGPARNAWWNDVLENGPGSPAAAFFDIDWRR